MCLFGLLVISNLLLCSHRLFPAVSPATMSTPQAAIRAEMDRLQGKQIAQRPFVSWSWISFSPSHAGTIDQRQKTISEAQNARLTHHQIARQLSSSSVWSTSPPVVARSRETAARPVPQTSARSVPLVTKNSWRLVPSSSTLVSSQSHHLGGTRTNTGSKKLILNKPVTAFPAKHTPFVQSAGYSSLPTPQPQPQLQPQPQPQSSNNTLPQQYSRLSPTRLFALASSSAATNPPPQPPLINTSVKQTTTNFKKMKLSASSKPFVPASNSRAFGTTSGGAQQLSGNKDSVNKVVIDGIAFARDPGGKKLVRTTGTFHSIPLHVASNWLSSFLVNLIAPVQKSPIQSGPPYHSNLNTHSIASSSIVIDHNNNNTPLKASIAGTTYVRTKSGNLIALSALKKHQASKLQDIKKSKLLALSSGIKNKYGSRNHIGVGGRWNPRIISRGRGYVISTSDFFSFAELILKIGGVFFLLFLFVIYRSMSMKISRPPMIKKNEQCRFFAKTGSAPYFFPLIFLYTHISTSSSF